MILKKVDTEYILWGFRRELFSWFFAFYWLNNLEWYLMQKAQIYKSSFLVPTALFNFFNIARGKTEHCTTCKSHHLILRKVDPWNVLFYCEHYAFPFSTLTLEKLKLLGLTLFLKDSKKSLLLLKQDKGCTLLNKNLQIIEFSSILR